MYTNKQIWNVSYPIFLSLLAQNIINVTDTAFLGRVGEVELGASAMGGLYYICVFTIAFGFSTGSQIVMARRNGERRYSDVGPVMIQGVFFLLALAAVMFTFSHLFAEDIIAVHDFFRYDFGSNGRVPRLACVRILFLFRQCDVPGAVYRYNPDKGIDLECCSDGIDECAARLPVDIRKRRFS